MRILVFLLALGLVLAQNASAAGSGGAQGGGGGLATGGGLVTQGTFASTQAGTDRGYTIGGQVHMIRVPTGTTATSIVISGLTPNSDYHAHVHVLSCADGAGGHYKNDPNGAADETNEIHFDFTTNAQGVGQALTQSAFYARPDAQTVIVHDPDKTKIGCVDLRTNGLAGK